VRVPLPEKPMDAAKYPHLVPVIERIENTPVTDPPPAWRKVGEFAVGGLQSVGFGSPPELLLVVSSSGRGVFDCRTGEKVARDYDDRGDDWDRPFALEALGIGPLAGQWVRMAGLYGGGLTCGTEEEWWVERLAWDWPDDILLLSAPGSSMYGELVNQQTNYWKIAPGVTEVRAWGFSPTGRTLLLATSSDLTIWTRHDGPNA
jgi:hypothetical protein